MRYATREGCEALLPWLARARERWGARPGRCEPVALRARLSSPIVRPRRGGVSVEGMLQHAVIVAETGEMPDTAFADWPRDLLCDVPVPVEDVEMLGRPIACASWPTFDAAGPREGVVMYTHKPELEGVAARKLMVAGGECKPKRVAVPTLAAATVTWHLRADVERLRALLAGCRSLSRWRGAGHGSVEAWEVLPSRDDWSLTRGGSPSRPLPIADLATAAERFPGGYDVDRQTTRAPYWHHASRCLVALPPGA